MLIDYFHLTGSSESHKIIGQVHVIMEGIKIPDCKIQSQSLLSFLELLPKTFLFFLKKSRVFNNRHKLGHIITVTEIDS